MCLGGVSGWWGYLCDVHCSAIERKLEGLTWGYVKNFLFFLKYFGWICVGFIATYHVDSSYDWKENERLWKQLKVGAFYFG